MDIAATRHHLLLRTSEIRAIEAEALARTPAGELMARAASAVADAAERHARAMPAGCPILAFCGPGNNGGDALLAAMLLRERGFDARACELAGAAAGAQPPADTARVRASAQLVAMTPLRVDTSDALRALLAKPGPMPLVLDGLFGIGLARPLAGLAAELCRLLADMRAPVIAIDVPSGIDADTGSVVGGADGMAMRAVETITMIADKPGLHTGRALDHVGRVSVAPLGLETADGCRPAADAACGELFGLARAADLLPPRPRDSSKGSFGAVLVVGGATGMHGAALLAARAAQASGAGKVWIAAPNALVFDPGQPQLMTRDADAPFDGVGIIVAGCGLGTDARAAGLLERVLASQRPTVLDADALNLLARRTQPVPSDAPCVLTPHPLEAARLAGRDVAAIQADRVGAALALARSRNAIVVLKGAGTVVAAPDGRWAIIDAGGPALATAGTGDVLAGLIGGLIAQGVATYEAALLGCWAHGDAADRWSAAQGRGAGLSAAELPVLARASLAAITR
jgi:hydroxyethylthiazole kinase-like uncharacterized protein yjeF